MLYKLLETAPKNLTLKVLVLTGRNDLSNRLESLDVSVEYLRVGQGRFPNLGAIFRLMSIARRFSPDVIQGWMYHGNLAASIICMLSCRKARLFWNIRQTLYSLEREKKMTRLVIQMSRILAPSPTAIVYNSVASAAQHEALGYPMKSRKVIPNGFNTDEFQPDPSAKASVTRDLDLGSSGALVLHVARFHPMKDHSTLMVAAKQVLMGRPQTTFLLVGRGVTESNQELVTLRSALGIEDAVYLAGERHDIFRLMAAADLLVLSSAWGEGFPNVLGEAMACGTPCVSTDVGDCRNLIGDTGCVVRPRDPSTLAYALLRLLADEERRSDLGARARRRIESNFSIDVIAQRYMNLYQGEAH